MRRSCEQYADEAPQQVRRLQRQRETVQKPCGDFHLGKRHAEREREDEIEASDGTERDQRGHGRRPPIHHRDDEERERAEAQRKAHELQDRDRERDRRPDSQCASGAAPVDPARAVLPSGNPNRAPCANDVRAKRSQREPGPEVGDERRIYYFFFSSLPSSRGADFFACTLGFL